MDERQDGNIIKRDIEEEMTGRPRMLARLPGMKSRNPYRTATGRTTSFEYYCSQVKRWISQNCHKEQ